MNETAKVTAVWSSSCIGPKRVGPRLMRAAPRHWTKVELVGAPVLQPQPVRRPAINTFISRYMPPHVVAVRRVQHQNRRGAGQNCGTAHFGGVPRKGAPTLRKPCFYALRSKNFGLEIALQGRQKDMKVHAISIMARKEDLVYHYNQRKVVWFRPQAMRVYSWKH
jgi:hypothetical protein